MGPPEKINGPLTRGQALALLIVCSSVAAWFTQPVHGLNPAVVGIFCLSLFFATGLIKVTGIGTAISWDMAIFIGGWWPRE
ncbi:MAG: hypothetical protein M1609_05475 [Firmicutes bacterium]|nr:hypothetical protein [Bacillota bacterium]